MKRIINFRPTIILSVDVLLAILSPYLIKYKSVFAGIFCIILAIFTLFIIIIKNKNRLKGVLGFTLIFCSLFFICFGHYNYKVDHYENANLGNHIMEVNGEVSKVIENENSTSLVLSNCTANGKKLNYKIAVYVSSAKEIQLGDVITYTDYLMDLDSYYDGEFSSYYITSGVKYTSSVKGSELTIIGNRASIFNKIATLFKSTLKSGLEEEEFSVAYAMILGDTGYIGDELLTNFRQSGIAHIFAVSGLHITVLASFISFVLKKCKIKGLPRCIITIVAIFFYSGVCGFSVSSLRACIMVGVMLIAKNCGKKYDSISAIGLAMILILLISPTQLFNVGFQLSFSVVLAIIFLSGRLQTLFRFLPVKLAGSIAVSISAFLGTLPVLLMSFSAVSIWAILLNVIFIPIISILFIFILISTILGCIAFSNIILFVPNYLIKFINVIISSIYYKPLVLKGIIFGEGALLLYLIFFTISKRVNIKFQTRRFFCLVLSLLLITNTVLLNIHNKQNVKLVVTGSSTLCTTLVVSNENALIVSSAKSFNELYRLKRAVVKNDVDKIDKVIIGSDIKEEDLIKVIQKLYSIVEIESVYISYGLSNQTKSLIEKNFKKLKLLVLQEHNLIKGGNFDLRYEGGGRAIRIISYEIDGVIFGETGKDESYLKNLDSFSFAVTSGHEQYLLSAYPIKKLICYVNSGYLPNAQSKGNAIIKITKQGKID